MVALLVGIEVREKVGGDRVLRGVDGKLDTGQRGRRQSNSVGGSDRIAKKSEHQYSPSNLRTGVGIGMEIHNT